MFFIYLLAFILITGLSFFLAWRSMKDFQDKPSGNVAYGSFLVRHPEFLDREVITRIHRLGLEKHLQKKINPFILSFEKLAKGTNRVLVIYGPKEILAHFPNLSLLELEDYCEKIYVGQMQCFEIGLEKGAALSLSSLELFKQVYLVENEYLFLQIVTEPQKGASLPFQTTIRILISAKESSRRVEIGRLFEESLRAQTGLKRLSKKRTSLQQFESYKARSLTPVQFAKLEINIESLEKFLRG